MKSKLTGLPAAPGIACGPAYIKTRTDLCAERQPAGDAQQQLDRLESALKQAEAELIALATRAAQQVGKEEAGIFEAQKSMLRDPELLKRVSHCVQSEGINIAFAWQEAIHFYADTLGKVKDEYLAARAVDLDDVGRRVLSLLMGQPMQSISLQRPSIIVADDLTPADTMLFERAQVLAFCIQGGGPTSHVAILSKALGVPCIVGLGPKLGTIQTGAFVIADGGTGELLIEPDLQTRKNYESLVACQSVIQQDALRNASLPAVTLDGQRVDVGANVGSYSDAIEAVRHGAEGIGLLRTEFLFLDRPTPPDEAEQVQVYTRIFEVIGKSKPIVVRTLDIGGDKPASYLDLPEEKNPFLGLRGLRLTLRFRELFECQLRALLIAGWGYDLRIMFPMVASLEELSQGQSILEASQLALAAEGKPYCQNVQLGIMIEVPSAAIMAHVFAECVDFFSIGTNDLSQYTLAAERTSADAAYLADAFHPAVLELIHRVIEAAHSRGKWVGLCGEMAGDTSATPLLLGLGLDEFSAAPMLVPLVKQTIRHCSESDARAIAERALTLSTAKEVHDYLQEIQKKGCA